MRSALPEVNYSPDTAVKAATLFIPERSGPFPGIQIFRAAAVLAVTLCHVLAEYHNNIAPNRIFDNLICSWTVGVDLFFVISGFVIFHSTFTGQPQIPTIGHFIWQRFTRIYPIYWVALLCLLLSHAAGYLNGLEASHYNIFTAILLIPRDLPILSTAWTLSYEVFFYAIFALTLMIRSPIWSVALTTLMVVTALVVGRFSEEGELAHFLRYDITVEFCFGLMLGLWVHRRGLTGLPKRWWLLPITLYLLSVPWWFPHEEGLAPEPRAWLWGVPCVLVVASALQISASKSKLARSMILIGNASYAIYLFHPIILLVFGRVMRVALVPRWTWELLGLGAFMGSVMTGLLIHLWIERPMLRLLRKHIWRAPVAPLVPA